MVGHREHQNVIFSSSFFAGDGPDFCQQHAEQLHAIKRRGGIRIRSFICTGIFT